MLKLVKFEFLRKRMTFLIALAVTVLGQVYALYQYFKIEESVREIIYGQVFGIFISIVALGFGLIFLIDVIFLFRNDLFKQEGYMLFMTPHNGYKLLGAKLLFALLEGIGMAVVFLIIALFNAKIMNMGSFDFSLSDISSTEWQVIIKGLAVSILVILEFALTVYLSFALFKSLFNNTRFKGLITFVIFIVINILKSKLAEIIGDMLGTKFDAIHISTSSMMLDTVNSALSYGIVATLVSAVILFAATGYLLENRINL
ncbi:hypothetical protein [Fusibacter bizertensis]